jgi:hypothetical protein
LREADYPPVPPTARQRARRLQSYGAALHTSERLQGRFRYVFLSIRRSLSGRQKSSREGLRGSWSSSRWNQRQRGNQDGFHRGVPTQAILP